MTQEEKREMEILRSDNVEFAKTIESLKRQIGGYKTSNEGYRNKITELQERVEHYKQLDLEGDELYEKRIAEIEELKLTVKAKTNTITGLESQVRKMSEVLKEKDGRIEELKSDVVVAEANLEHYKNMPWYKRMFANM